MVTGSGVLTEDLCALPRVALDVSSGVTGWSVRAEGWSSEAVETTGSGVLEEDLGVLPRGARDVGLGVTGWSVEVEGWGSGAVDVSGLEVLIEDLCVLPRVALDVSSGATEQHLPQPATETAGHFWPQHTQIRQDGTCLNRWKVQDP